MTVFLTVQALTLPLFALSPTPIDASVTSGETLPAHYGGARVSVRVNGRSLYQDEPLLLGSTTYVALEDFRAAVGDTSPAEITVSRDALFVAGRALYIPSGTLSHGGKTYLPVRTAAQLYLGSVSWDAQTGAVDVTLDRRSIAPADEVYEANDLYWLARIISAESRGESLLGQLAVGSVVCNRVDAPNFPNTIPDVIFDRKFGVQFTPVANGTIYDEPTDLSLAAAKMTLEGYRVSNSILYFLYEAIATNLWTVNNCTYEMTIGCHDFYS